MNEYEDETELSLLHLKMHHTIILQSTEMAIDDVSW